MNRRIAKVQFSVQLIEECLKGNLREVGWTNTPKDMSIIDIKRKDVWTYEIYFTSIKNKVLRELEEPPLIIPWIYTAKEVS